MNKYKNTRNGFEIKTIKDTQEAVRFAQSRYVKCLICNKAMHKIFAKYMMFGKPPIIIDDSVPDSVFLYQC